MRAILAVNLAVLSVAITAVRADDIQVTPGDQTLSAAAAKAKPGDVLILAAGTYTGSAELPEKVTLRGAGSDKTIISSNEYAVLKCAGPDIIIQGVEIRGGEKTTRGVNTSASVRIERCRFTSIAEAVALTGSPLSDIVFCDFDDCGIAIRAIAKSSPTVWGCRFKGGNIAIFNIDGAPYIRHNLITDSKFGVRIVSDNQAIIRNNIFLNCPEAGIDAQPRKAPIMGPVVRNNVFDSCGAAMLVSDKMARCVSDNVIHNIAEPAFRDSAAAKSLDAQAQRITTADPGFVLNNGELGITNLEPLTGKGIRLGNQPKGTLGDIGPDLTLTPFGSATPADAVMPPVRFTGPIYIANSVGEEYMALQMWGLQSAGQSLTTESGVKIDKHKTSRADVKFDIERFFHEMAIESEGP